MVSKPFSIAEAINNAPPFPPGPSVNPNAFVETGTWHWSLPISDPANMTPLQRLILERMAARKLAMWTQLEAEWQERHS